LTLIMSTAPAIAQTITSAATPPYCKESTPPPGAVRPATPMDPNARFWMLLWGYGGNHELYEHWQLGHPPAAPITQAFTPPGVKLVHRAPRLQGSRAIAAIGAAGTALAA